MALLGLNSFSTLCAAVDSMGNQTDPLARLVMDEAQANRELLASALEGRIRIDVGSGAIAFQSGARAKLNHRQVVLATLLAQRALGLLDGQHPKGLRPQDIEERTGIRGGTLRPILKILVEGDLIRQMEDKAYFVPSHAFEAAKGYLDGKGESA
jgi:hypothetical protein